jgi:uncharacterized protein involved in outer membrane biogenesis
MKKFGKIIKISGIVLLVLIISLISAPFIFKGKIIRIVKEQANENLMAIVNFNEDISISLIRSFPDLSLGIKELSVIGIDSFAGDTLFYAEDFRATINIKSLWSDKIEIKKIHLEKPNINLLVMPSGKANWDIAIPDTIEIDEEESVFSLGIKSLTINEGRVIYHDQEMDFKAKLIGLNHDLKGDFTQDEFLMKTVSTIKEFTMSYEGFPYLSKVKTELVADMDMNMKDMKFTFIDNVAKLNGLEMKADGFVQLNDDDMDFDLTFAALKNEFSSFMSLIPAIYAKDFEKVTSKGTLAFDGFFKGKMTDDAMPGFGLNLLIENGYMKYPDLPAPLQNVFVDLRVINKTGEDKDLVADLRNLSLQFDNDPFKANLLYKNLVSPYVDGAISGKVNLENITKFVDLDGATLKGLLATDMLFKGAVKTLEAGRYEDFDANGNFSLTDFFYKDSETPDAYEIQKFSLILNPRLVQMPVLIGKIGETDFNANGQLSNFFPYIFSDGTLKGNLNYASNYVNLNQFMTEDPNAESDTVEMTMVEIPTNIDFSMNADIKKMLYDDLILENMRGNLMVKDGKIFFNKVAMNTLGGSIAMDGEFDGRNPKMPFSDIKLNMRNFDIPKALAHFDLLKTYAPFAEKMTGFFSMDLDMQTHLNEHLDIQYPTLTGFGVVTLTNAAISNTKILNEVADKLKLEKFRKLEMKNQSIKFKINNGQFLVDSFEIPVWENAKMKMAGHSTFEQGLNYAGLLSMPRTDLGPANKELDNLLSKAKGKGVDIKLDEKVNIALGITGTFTNPKLEMDLKKTAAGLGESLKEQAKEQLKELVDKKQDEAKEKVEEKIDESKEKARADMERRANEVIANAERQANNIRREAKSLADKTRAEGETQAKRIEDEAKNPLEKAVAKKAADRVRQEANEKADKLESEANQRAQKVMDEANKQADRIRKGEE